MVIRAGRYANRAGRQEVRAGRTTVKQGAAPSETCLVGTLNDFSFPGILSRISKN